MPMEGMGGFFPGAKDQFLMGENKMLRNQSKPCAGESQIIGFAGGGTDDVVQLVIDRDDMMAAGKNMLQKIGRNINNLAVRPDICRGDAFLASLFAFLRQWMLLVYDADKGVFAEFLKSNVISREFCIFHAHD